MLMCMKCKVIIELRYCYGYIKGIAGQGVILCLILQGFSPSYTCFLQNSKISNIFRVMTLRRLWKFRNTFAQGVLFSRRYSLRYKMDLVLQFSSQHSDISHNCSCWVYERRNIRGVCYFSFFRLQIWVPSKKFLNCV